MTSLSTIETVSSVRRSDPTISERYNTYSRYLKKRFGRRVHKITVDAGFNCPNRDGTLSDSGCIYCNNDVFSPASRFRNTDTGISAQIETTIPQLKNRYKAERFLVYFQPYTNTYAPVETLERIYREALAHEDVIGIAVGTRPDCVDKEKLFLLETLARNAYVAVEYGCESVHDKSLRWMNRGHLAKVFFDAMKLTRNRGIDIGVHLILGLPTENHADMMQTARRISEMPVQIVKLHHLHVIHDTPLEKLFNENPFPLSDLESYVRLVCDFIERLRPDIVVERLCGESHPDVTVAPTWHVKGPTMARLVTAELSARNTFQGIYYEP